MTLPASYSPFTDGIYSQDTCDAINRDLRNPQGLNAFDLWSKIVETFKKYNNDNHLTHYDYN